MASGEVTALRPLGTTASNCESTLAQHSEVVTEFFLETRQYFHAPMGDDLCVIHSKNTILNCSNFSCQGLILHAPSSRVYSPIDGWIDSNQWEAIGITDQDGCIFTLRNRDREEELALWLC